VSDAGELAGKAIAICDDGAEWPPFTYYERNVGKKTAHIVGFAVDVIDSIASDEHAQTSIALIPWDQCLAKLAKGEYDMALNASYNDARARYALFSEPYYSLTPSFIFLKGKFSGAFKMADANQLAKRKMCGLRGYSYADFGVDVSLIDADSQDFDAAFQKLRAGRCDVILARIEVLNGFAKVGDNYLTKDIDYGRIKEANRSEFHMLISKKSTNRDDLRAAINRGIEKLKASGTLKKMLDRYLQ